MKEKNPLWPTVDSKKEDSKERVLNPQGSRNLSGNDQGEQLDKRDLQISQWIQKMPDLEPPPDLLSSVMQSVQPKRNPWPKRVLLWGRSPKSITFVPLRIAPVAIALFGIFVLTGYFIMRQQNLRLDAHYGESRIPVVFNLSAPEAHSVAVIGTFNGWKPGGYEMHFDGEKKKWSLTVHLPEGRYEYAFLVDGEKVFPDPKALLHQKDGFGNENSVMILGTKNGKTT
jgi:hypothetical protein